MQSEDKVVTMAEGITLLLFTALLVGCVAADISVLIALLGGLVCFCAYAAYCGYRGKDIAAMLLAGVNDARTILVVFLLIGMLTAVWRAAGTIPCIVYHAASAVIPKYFVALTFLLCGGMSILTGTSFGTVSTMGVICGSIGTALQIPVAYTAGAVLSGIYVGEQCSPMSSSALLVCELTGTDIYQNIIGVIKMIAVPFLLTLACYCYMGTGWGAGIAQTGNLSVFAENFHLSALTLLPAAVIIIFSIFRIRVEITMITSILSAVFLCVFLQKMPVTELLLCLIAGYRSDVKELNQLLSGGGLVSMADTGAIVAISSAYFGIFRATKLLDQIKRWVCLLAKRSNSFFATIIVSAITCAISCNQTLATMLTCEMTKTLVSKKQELAMNLVASVLIIAAWIPWSIALVFPLSVLDAPIRSLGYAFYLFLVPAFRLVWELRKKRGTKA